MKKPVIAVAVVIVIIAAVILVISMNHKSTSSTTATTTSNTPAKTDTSTPSTSSTTSTSNAVTIQNFAFSPASITVKKGTTVTWTNQDSTAHTVTETDGQTGPASGDLGTGKSYSFTFNTAGTFKYHCSIHTNMTGTVTVTD
jgi:plastocyanin